MNTTDNFICSNCKKTVVVTDVLGTKNRNHCPYCLWSKHVDGKVGDRLSDCNGKMKPVGLTFKEEGVDKYGNKKQGEIMLIHRCEKCVKISINRIAGDDDPEIILKVFENIKLLSNDDKGEILKQGITVLKDSDLFEMKSQLFGKI